MSRSTDRRLDARRALAVLALLATAGVGACAAPTAPTDRAPTVGARRVFLNAASKDTTSTRDSTGVTVNGGGHVDPNI